MGGHTNTEHTRLVSGEKRGGSVLASGRKGSGSHSGEWRGGSMLSDAEMETEKNSETVAKEKQLPSGLDMIACAGRAPRSIT